MGAARFRAPFWCVCDAFHAIFVSWDDVAVCSRHASSREWPARALKRSTLATRADLSSQVSRAREAWGLLARVAPLDHPARPVRVGPRPGRPAPAAARAGLRALEAAAAV